MVLTTTAEQAATTLVKALDVCNGRAECANGPLCPQMLNYWAILSYLKEQLHRQFTGPLARHQEFHVRSSFYTSLHDSYESKLCPSPSIDVTLVEVTFSFCFFCCPLLQFPQSINNDINTWCLAIYVPLAVPNFRDMLWRHNDYKSHSAQGSKCWEIGDLFCMRVLPWPRQSCAYEDAFVPILI